ALGTAILALAAANCAHAPPTIDGVAPTPAAPSSLWNPTPAVTAAGAHDAATLAVSPNAAHQYTLAQIVDVALRNSPATKVSWTQARAAADVYGSTEGRLYPSVIAGVGANQQLTSPTPGRASVERSQYGPTISLAYTVLDFGGRSGSVDVARQTAVAADLTHNSTVENTILQVETAAFGFLSTRSQRDAAKAGLDEATAALDAANERHRVGLATIADVLQAKTARSQAELALETLDGSLLVTRGALAVAMGLPANTQIDVPDVPAADSAHFVAESVDTLIELAVRNRPELATARAQASAAQSQIKVVKAAALPAFALTATGATNGSSAPGFSGPVYQLGIGIQVPIFTGFSTQFDARAAQEQYQSALARAEATKQQVIQEVFTAYYTLRTSTQRVRTTRDLLASAEQSEVVARERYKEGVGSIVDLLIAQSALASARAEAVDARWTWRSSLAQLAHDVGVLNARGDTSFSALTPAPDVRPDR
ncbi:MAG: TolC family protein, partial [Gemmatimonadaceae bacterium]